MTTQSAATGPGQRRRSWLPASRIWQQAWLPAIFVVCSLMATAGTSWTLWNQEFHRHDAERDRVLAEVISAVDLEMESYAHTLRGVEALHSASEIVEPDEFDQFIESSQVLSMFPGIQAVVWNRLVPAENLEEYEASMSAQIGEPFSVYPATTSELLVAELVAPDEGNESNLGFNIMGEAHRAEAFERAREENRPIATAPIALVQDKNRETPTLGFLVVLATGPNHGAPHGAAVGVFRAEEVLAGPTATTGFEYRVTDIGSDRAEPATPSVLNPSVAGEPDLAVSQEMSVLGRRWQITLIEGQFDDPSIAGTLAALIVGLAATVAIGWVAHSRGQTQRAFSTANEMARRAEAAHRDITVMGNRLDRGVRTAGIRLWEVNLTTGARWASTDDANDGLVLTDVAGVPDRRIVGFSGDNRPFADQIHPDDRERILNPPVPGPGEINEQHFRLVGKDGKERWMLARSHTVKRGDEQLVIGAHIDITERHAYTELIEKLNEELTERNHSLDEFCHIASHDLRSPLRAIGSVVGFVREDVEDLDPVIEGHLAKIEHRLERMCRLIDDLLIYARSYGQEEQQLTKVCEKISDVVETVDTPSHLEIRVDCDVPPVHVATTPLMTCIRNLVDNALKHHGKDSGFVDLRVTVQDGFLKVEVSDDGQGIDATSLRKVFEPFRRLRVDETTPGSGIGLSVVDRATRAHGATVEVTSEVGIGTTFALYWPFYMGQIPPTSRTRKDVDLVHAPV